MPKFISYFPYYIPSHWRVFTCNLPHKIILELHLFIKDSAFATHMYNKWFPSVVIQWPDVCRITLKLKPPHHHITQLRQLKHIKQVLSMTVTIHDYQLNVYKVYHIIVNYITVILPHPCVSHLPGQAHRWMPKCDPSHACWNIHTQTDRWMHA